MAEVSDPHRIEDPIQVVALVLHHPRMKAIAICIDSYVRVFDPARQMLTMVFRAGLAVPNLARASNGHLRRRLQFRQIDGAP